MELAIKYIVMAGSFYVGFIIASFLRNGIKFFKKANKIMDIDNINIYVNKEN